MTEYRTWDQLSEREREQVRLMLFSLKEFSYGVDRMDEIWRPGQEPGAQARFYMTSLHQYCANYLMLAGAHKLRDVLRSLGSGDLLEPVEALLATPLGEESTFGEILKTFRNRFLTHQSFTLDPVNRGIYAKFDLDGKQNSARLTDMIEQLFRRTQQLYVALAMRFKEAFGT